MIMKRKVKEEKIAGPKTKASYLEVDASPCEIKFSEKFLVSIGGANRMFGIYSAKDEKRFLITPRLMELRIHVEYLCLFGFGMISNILSFAVREKISFSNLNMLWMPFSHFQVHGSPKTINLVLLHIVWRNKHVHE